MDSAPGSESYSQNQPGQHAHPNKSLDRQRLRFHTFIHNHVPIQHINEVINDTL